MASTEDSPVKSYFNVEPWIRFAVYNNPSMLMIIGIIPEGTWYDGEFMDHNHVAWESSILIPQELLQEESLDDLALHMGWFLTAQVEMAYKVSQIPDNMIWLGNIRVGINMN
jgi:hypothetical protein